MKDETVIPADEIGRGEEQRKRRSNSPVVSNSEDSSSVALSTEGAPKGKERDRKFEIVVGDNLKKEDERNSRKRSEISMQDEIQQLALKKREILMKGKEPGLWKEEIQKSIEREIERRVRDALETPPLERMRRNKHRAKLRKMQMEKEFQDQQKLADTVATASPTLQSLLEGTIGEGNEKEDDRDQVIADIKRKAYHRYTREGFKEALKRGKLKLKKIGNGKFMDKNGVILTADGPFWPPECGPLYPKQEHVSGVPEGKELLSSDVPQETRTVENQKTKWFRPWEGTQVVFASERLSKGTVPHTTPDGCSQSIVFESRFESGNLRQARRVGQFEYDLVLKTDLYTNRHTQWFYFRVQKMLPGVTYKFNIVNLLKKDSLYNHGMRPLFYSENLASTKGLGWHRVGHHITYSRNYNLSRNPLLHPEIAYYTLVWQMEFPEENDVCFLTHCYPFTFTDLCQHLDTICSDSERKKHIKREVMCESRAGNSCFLLTVSNFTDKNKQKSKKGVVVTARVHPGETNASWMMKGFLDFITSADSVANNLRKAFTFKIVPMLNPDGVIVGNYRCSLSARDLNRNFRHPKKQSFPTIWHTKTMLEEFGQETDVIAYCDLHGHSRKHNVFIYGCDQQGKEMDAATFLCQRLFPWLISKKAPDKFSFGGCKFQVRRCKESTGRVVMWRQMGITNSFTMEATFCGSKNIQREDNPRHFNTLDFQDMGRHFCEALLEYHKAQEDKSLHSEFILELTKVITHQVLTSRGLVPQNFNIFAKNLLAENDDEQGTTLQNNDGRVLQNEAASPKLVTGSGERGDASSRKKKNNDTSSVVSKITSRTNSSKNHHSSKSTKLKKQQLDSKIRSKLEALRFFDSMDSETIQGCINLIHDLHVMSEFAESDTSDSDSASESEIPMDPGEQEGGSPGKREKHKKKKTKTKKKAASAQSDVMDGERSAKPRRKKYTPHVNRYLHRSNNGIPMFSEERTQERAIKRLEAMRRMERERLEKEAHKILQDDEYARLIALTRELQKREAEVRFKLSSPPTVPLHGFPESTTRSACQQ
ncbi:putative cytosolic carboxypeptidase 2 isoform X10 [Apostichopus japonicus]|uniref:Putative cytosolic carboxypeptidase 2 isoform X10 n=1 Tax=Stichopus japonicus TaxID=307972 RepID=A0A2G8LCG4_STIJA|nr:putative cytosolic carboxypeptidase 2 isoform X10 [Apostichopus japonicus]